jgi:hypothetical protein
MAEKDKDYDDFLAKWKPRLGLKDRHIAESYMRASDPTWERGPPKLPPVKPGFVRIGIIQGTATLFGSIEPTMINEMMAEWQHQLDARADQNEDPRAFTRRVVSQYIALNQHRDETGELLICAAVWLTVTKPDAGELVALMRRGDAEVLYEIIYEDENRQTRFRLGANDLRES